MRAGSLRHEIQIEALDEGQDTFGDTDPSEIDDSQWHTFIARRASINPLVGRELLKDRVEQATGTHWVTFRHGTGVTPKMRVRYGLRKFLIKSVQNIEEKDQECRLLCEELI